MNSGSNERVGVSWDELPKRAALLGPRRGTLPEVGGMSIVIRKRAFVISITMRLVKVLSVVSIKKWMQELDCIYNHK